MPSDKAARSKPKKSKLEKIAELEASLKVSREESRQLRKEVEQLRGLTPSQIEPRNESFTFDNVDKLKDAIKALKKVTVNQEMSLNSLRSKAQQRRKELHEKDAAIGSLQRKVQSLEQAMNTEGKDDSTELRFKLSEAQRESYERQNEVADLQEQLEEARAEIRELKQQPNPMDHSVIISDDNSGSHTSTRSFNTSNTSFRSFESGNTRSEFDVVTLKKQLALKSNKLIAMERELEKTKDKLCDSRQLHQKPGAFEYGFAFAASPGKGLGVSGSPRGSVGTSSPVRTNSAMNLSTDDDDSYSSDGVEEEEVDFW